MCQNSPKIFRLLHKKLIFPLLLFLWGWVLLKMI